MQTLLKTKKNIHPIFDEIEKFYTYVSDETHTELIKPVWDSHFEPLVELFNQYNGDNYKFSYANKPYKKLDYEVKSNDIVLCFSGGKDSIAVALNYLEKGFNVHLFHVKGINFSIADESKIAQEVAEKLGLELHIEEIAFSGHHRFMEHPMKNMIIANQAIQYAIENGYGVQLGFANYYTSYLADNIMSVCGGDCMEMWDAYVHLLSNVIPDILIDCPLNSMGETLDILSDRWDLLDSSISCLCRHSLRQHRHDWVKQKYGIDLPKYRCGSCYKCCVEYIYLADNDLLPFNRDYYRYCINQLYKVALRENVGVTSAFQVWYHFMFYSIAKSKIYGDLCAAVPLKTRIKWVTLGKKKED